MTDALRDIIDEHWRLLEAETVTSESAVRTSELPVETVCGPLVAAVDFDGGRHILVPVDSHQSVRKGLNGPALQLRKRALETEESYQQFADLGCLQTDLNEVFTSLSAEILQAVQVSADNPIKGLYRVLDQWKALFQGVGVPLGPQKLAGLFGELIVLQQMLDIDRSAHRLWRGPLGGRHDFASGGSAVEVKTSMITEGRWVRIHGLEQLDPPPGGALELVWLRLESTSSRGVGFQDLVNQVLKQCDDEYAVLSLLAAAGYRPVDAEHYRQCRFEVVEARWYGVDIAFPRLTRGDLIAAGVVIRVQDVEYTIELTSEPPFPLDEQSVSRHLRAMIEEPA
ncbi:PD-(D/E)XK motif protein [Nocardia ninae]|uniref:PD-(D/E)XK motif protein n=1 Tax=Nocardia ninae NBRC 108245 TaxID=1210091 RepID=A0A511MA83_9NOCA|nr:PD-(D/E)XK motif protein [Nocardia ninae]GEM37008.1 hypothetical protein NN4_15270 [Nocardia ninae NBRC 108245]